MFGDNGNPTSFLCGMVQYFRCLREVPLLCGRRHIFDASEKFPVTLLPFCVAGAIFSSPPRSASWPYVLFVWQVQYFRCLREVPSWPYVLFVWQVQYFRCLREVPSWPGPRGKPFPHPSPHPRTPVPPSVSLKVCGYFSQSSTFQLTKRGVTA